MKNIALLVGSFLSLVSTGWGDLVVSFDPADLTVTSTGVDQTVNLGILIDYSGTGLDTLSAFTLGFSESSPSLTVVTGSDNTGSNFFASDFTWSFSGVSSSAITGINGGDHTINTSGTQLLGTLQFTLNQAFTSGTIPIGLTFTSAQRGFGTVIPGSEVTVSGGTLTVAAQGVPEPASLAMMGLAACAAICLHRRRQRSAQRNQIRRA